jgi:hypothetical protein
MTTVIAPRMGDIGKPNKEIEFEPFPEAPIETPATPATTPAPAEPVPA